MTQPAHSTAGAAGAGIAIPATILGVLASSAVLGSTAWLGGTVGAALAGGGWAPPPYTITTGVEFLKGGPAALWPAAPTGGLVGMLVLLALVAVGLAVAGVLLWRRFSGTSGLATQKDMAALAPRAAEARARELRPALKEHTGRLEPGDRGVRLGDLDPRGPELRGSDEDTYLAVMAPRAGKTSALAVPTLLDAPGAALATANKSDVYAITRRERGRYGRTAWTLDAQGVAHAKREMWWDMLASARTIEGASRLAGHFTAAAADSATREDFWSKAGKNTLTALFHAAALDGGTVRDVLAWLATPADRGPVNILRSKNPALADQLASTVAGAVETRDGIYETARQAVACLLDPEISAWVTPDRARPEFTPQRFVRSQDTLYLLSKDGGGSAAGVVAAAADAVFRAGVVEAERTGGRLPTPMRAVLDEAANVCRISDLPALYSHLGSRGITPVTILQSYRQGVTVWSEAGMDALWSAATAKIVGSGIDDADFAEKLSRLIGEHKVQETSVSRGSSGGSTSVSRQRERILEAGAVRALPKGRALLLSTGTPVGMIRLRPWYSEPGAEQISEDAAAEEAAITQRAQDKVLS